MERTKSQLEKAERPGASSPETETAYFALGCFWSKEYAFSQVEGVLDTQVGYSGGHTDAPDYKQVCTKKTGHAETVEVTFDPVQVSFEALVKRFFQFHNPTVDRREKGGQYRSAIFYNTKTQQKVAVSLIQQLTDKGFMIYTEVAPLVRFWPAEERHQQYCLVRGFQPTPKGQVIPASAFS